MAEFIIVTDLPTAIQSAELVDAMVAGANAKASRVAPCLVVAQEAATPTAAQVDALAEAKLVLIGAVKRWVDAGSGALQSEITGPFAHTIDTRQRTGYNLWPSEISDLQAICKGLDATPSRAAFSIDTGGSLGTVHAESCALNFGALYCDCGADIAGFPLFESI
jgi:hypothetical protein